MKRLFIVKLFLLLYVQLVTSAFAQKKQFQVFPLAFYNLENLFDAFADTSGNDAEFTPMGPLQWTEEKYAKKIRRLGHVLSQLGKQYSPSGPALIGVCEIENKRVLQDLVADPGIRENNYQIVHFDSPDRRGIDVAMLYDARQFELLESRAIPFKMPEKATYVTRDILFVKGRLSEETIYVYVNHWPSRFTADSWKLRGHAATILKSSVDSLQRISPDAKIIIMGDFNDDPVDKSLTKELGARVKKQDVIEGGLFNTMYGFYQRGIGTLGYLGKWNLFDQLIISSPLLNADRGKLRFWKSEIFNPDFLISKEGRYKGYPFRTFSGNMFQNGYSDHFPVILYLIKEIIN
ncbi:endonuclease/exonuclease/phosphatase family protein [Sphingobacterium sp. BN32]|uniref:endonuclease/exonuclease/phosphatase family protein n=1 Tax=Sphingobacterium sp. BN32 TaxID=3058432 RepID=UPI00265CB8D7|nr:endonuclease/exonuclease/phosphatase family protein [Sphingobacterium sp. BN32]WKK57325.1 endonuclease/exonuclease/phosphatase family protein [Sphingobacterium sp. BN32]